MGNSTSKSDNSAEKEFDNFYDVIDYIATYYILTMDFKSLSKLSEKEYCDKLVVLTSDIIQRYFNDMEVTYLAQRIQNGVEVNKLNKDDLVFINKDKLETLDVSNDEQKSIRKKRVCIGIAKFYVKIAHIFAAIVMTVNPVYTYKNENGETVKTSLLNKDAIPKNADKKLYKLNICDNRIRALKKGESVDDITGDVTIHPKVCDFNTDTNGQIKTLEDEPGIPELMNLYLDDNYDYSNGTFTGMSESTKSKFNSDLRTFYTAFTGNDNMPEEITKFSDIKLRDYSSKKGCRGDEPVFKSKYTLNKNNELFSKYAENTKKMIQTAADNQLKLLSVINDLFRYVIDPYSGKKRIRVNPKLTEDSLQNAIVKTRRFIIDLYVKCEQDYVNGIKLYEAIVESKILETTESQIETLKTEANKIITETKNSVEPPDFEKLPNEYESQEINPEEIKPQEMQSQEVQQEVQPEVQEMKPQEMQPVQQEMQPVQQEMQPVQQEIQPVQQEMQPQVPPIAQPIAPTISPTIAPVMVPQIAQPIAPTIAPVMAPPIAQTIQKPQTIQPINQAPQIMK